MPYHQWRSHETSVDHKLVVTALQQWWPSAFYPAVLRKAQKQDKRNRPVVVFIVGWFVVGEMPNKSIKSSGMLSVSGASQLQSGGDEVEHVCVYTRNRVNFFSVRHLTIKYNTDGFACLLDSSVPQPVLIKAGGGSANFALLLLAVNQRLESIPVLGGLLFELCREVGVSSFKEQILEQPLFAVGIHNQLNLYFYLL